MYKSEIKKFEWGERMDGGEPYLLRDNMTRILHKGDGRENREKKKFSSLTRNWTKLGGET